MQDSSQPPQTAIAPNPLASVNQANVNTALAGTLIVTISLVSSAAVTLYKRYRVSSNESITSLNSIVWHQVGIYEASATVFLFTMAVVAAIAIWQIY